MPDTKKACRVVQMVEHLPSKCKALVQTPVSPKKREREREKERERRATHGLEENTKHPSDKGFLLRLFKEFSNFNNKKTTNQQKMNKKFGYFPPKNI
jgi:hypothetical protein